MNKTALSPRQNDLAALGFTYNYNIWSATDAWFDTLVVFQLNDVNVQLGPITKTGTLTLESDSDTSDAYTGTLTAQNVFGQTVAVGSKTNTVYAPIVLKAVPNEGAQFMGVEDTSGGVATALAQDGLYRYDFESNGATVKARWGELVKLPSLRVSRTDGSGVPDTGYTCPLDFITSTNQNLSANYTDPGYIYSFSLDGLDDASEGWTYAYKIDAGAEQAFAAGQTVTLPVRFESRQIQFFAKKDGKTYTATFAVTINGSASTTDSSDASTVAQVGSNYYYFVEDALQAANSGTVILRKNASFCAPDYFTNERWGAAANGGAGYTVKSGVTLLVPNDSNAPTITDAGSKSLYTTDTAKHTEYRRLTLPKGITLTVNGALVVGGQWHVPAGGQPMMADSYGLIMMQDGSHISVEPSGKLYAWGYISGTLNQDRTQVAGGVTAKSGSTLYEIFQIQDFRGGSQTKDLLKKVFPINQYYIQNIEVPLTVHSGATETVATAMYIATLKSTSATSLTLVGRSSGLFQLTDDKSNLLRTYNPKEDRVIYALNGNAAISSISLDMVVSFYTEKIDSADYYLPITSNMTINVESGNTKIESDVALLPGVEMNIAKNATTTVALGKTLFVYDADEWVNKGYVGAGGKQDMIAAPYSVANGTTAVRKNESLVDAAVTVKGTLDAQGNVCTSESGADITVESGGTLKIGPNGIGKADIKQAKGSENPVTISNTSAQLKNADGSYSQTAGVKDATLTKKDGDAFIKTSSDGTTEQETVKLQDSTGAIKRFYTYEAAIAAITTSKETVTLTALRSSDEGMTVSRKLDGKILLRKIALVLGNYELSGTVTNESTLTIQDGNFDGAIENSETGAKLNINGGIFNGPIQNAVTNGILKITDGTFNGPISNNGSKSMTIQGGIFNGTVTNGLSTSATISNGTFAKLLNRGTVTLNSGKFNEVENQGTITVTSPADVKIKSLPITGTLVDSKGTPLTLGKTADAEGYYSLTENTATIRFNCNGTKDGKVIIATGETVEKKVHLVGSTAYDYPFTMTAENYSFKGWAMSADATEALFKADKTMKATLDAQTLKDNGATVGGMLNLYAVYQKEWSYKIIWNVDGKQVQETHWTDSMKEALYTLAADVTNAITEVKVTGPEKSYTMTRRNRSVTLADVKADLTVDITTGKEEGNATYYMGEMSFQYYKNMAVFTNDGWKMLDNYTWRHKTGSVTHEVGENTYTVANGDILLVNDSNQVYAYTIMLAEKGAGFDWAHMEFLLDGKAVVGQDEIKVEVQPGKKATVTAKMVGDTEKLDMKDQPLGKIKVEMQPAE